MSIFSHEKFSALLCAMMAFVFMAFASASSALALEPVDIVSEQKAIDLTNIAERYTNQKERLVISTAADENGIVRRIEVRAKRDPNNSHWAVFALSNKTDEQIDRYVVTPHFRLSGSQLFWPDLGSRRIASITQSEGFAPEQISSQEADIYLITLNPGDVVTFVAELNTPDFPKLQLWEPNAYKEAIDSFTLYRGIVIGISGLLVVFLTILFVVKGTAVFPATALLAWSILVYVCIDFNFWNKLVDIAPGQESFWRATAEIFFAAALHIFLFAYLTLNRWHVRYSVLTLGWLVGLIALLGVALVDPPIAAGIARVSVSLTAVLGLLLVIYLSIKGYDRAILLFPTWLLLVAWVAGAWLTITGMLEGEIVQPALIGGLVLFILLIGFTVMQNAFSGGGIAENYVSDTERQALALIGAGDIVWDWDVGRDRVQTDGQVERLLGIKEGALVGPARDWLAFLHPNDHDRFKATLDAVLEHKRGRINHEFRLRADDGHYRTFKLRARPVVGANGEVVRCIGTLLDITETKMAQERMLHDAVLDNLTGLANRKLFTDRIEMAATRARLENTNKPAVFVIDIDRFKQVNDSLGLSVGDSIIITVTRRLGRLLKPQDSLARLGGDQFGLLLLSEQDPERIASFADSLRRAISAPISFNDREIFLTASIGIALHEGQSEDQPILADAEIAMHQAKRLGGDRIEAFRPIFRNQSNDPLAMEADLRRAIERGELTVFYQPIIRLSDNSVAGFEALLRWRHPKRGEIAAAEFIPIVERTGMIFEVGLFVLDHAAKQLSAWQDKLNSKYPLFMSVNVSSRQLLRHDLINDVKSVLSRWRLIPGTLKLEITETVMMDNPEYANQVLSRVRELGASLSLDDFGTGYSSLSYLQRFPFETIKIDKSFVKSEPGSERPLLLKSIVAMANDLDMDVIAEGVESEEDAQALYQLKCEYGQGFHFGTPMTAADAEKFLMRELTEAAT